MVALVNPVKKPVLASHDLLAAAFFFSFLALLDAH
jgi:hypothetical protein